MDELATRRRFLGRLSVGLSAMAGAVVSVPIVAYLLSPLLGRRADWSAVGAVGQFKIGQTVEVAVQDPSSLPWAGQTARTAAWLRRDSETQFTAFAVNCTHLGCPVRWEQKARLFLCPCHGGVYYADGRVAGGPPPRPLFTYEVRVQNGQVELRNPGLQVS